MSVRKIRGKGRTGHQLTARAKMPEDSPIKNGNAFRIPASFNGNSYSDSFTVSSKIFNTSVSGQENSRRPSLHEQGGVPP